MKVGFICRGALIDVAWKLVNLSLFFFLSLLFSSSSAPSPLSVGAETNIAVGIECMFRQS